MKSPFLDSPHTFSKFDDEESHKKGKVKRKGITCSAKTVDASDFFFLSIFLSLFYYYYIAIIICL